MGEARRKKLGLDPITGAPLKAPQFSIKKFSKKIQRRYAFMKKISEQLAEHYRNNLKEGADVASLKYRDVFTRYKRAYGRPYRAPQSQLDQFKEYLQTAPALIPGKHVRDYSHDWLGIEIECSVDLGKIPENVGARSLSGVAAYFGFNGLTRFQVVTDGSVRTPVDDKAGRQWLAIEVNLLTHKKNGYANLIRLCNLLKTLDARVNKRCGLHVHLDCREYGEDKVNSLAERFVSALPLLAAMQHPLRRENRFCRLAANRADSGNFGASRYYAVNAAAYSVTRTIEIRLHSGTTNADKIVHWLELLQAIKATPFGGHIKTPAEAILKLPTLTPSTAEYIAARVELFSGDMVAVSKKNRAGVPFVDDDAEEVRLNDLVNHELFSALMRDVGQVRTFDHVVTFFREFSRHSENIGVELGTKSRLLFEEAIIEKAHAAANAVNYTARRDLLQRKKYESRAARCNSNQLAGLCEQVDSIYYGNLSTQSYHPDHISKEARAAIRKVLEARQSELDIESNYREPAAPPLALDFSRYFRRPTVGPIHFTINTDPQTTAHVAEIG